ncbi:MAG: TonB-dependent receptor plug domain-containing protein [Rhodoferax sp.]
MSNLTQYLRGYMLLAMSALLTHMAWAQKTEDNQYTVNIIEQPLEYRQFNKVEITGSAILAKESKAALPVQVISRQDIERSGSTGVPELLQKLAGMFNFFELGTMTGTVQGGPESAAIHGNPNGTLVLLNGRRLPYYGSQTIFGERATVDLNLVPLSAIERIEVLTDGASSRYGSDAVAGVINIITKDNAKGFSVSTEYVRPAGGVAQGHLLNLTWGNGKLANEGYRLQAHLSLEKQNELLAGDRDTARNGAVQFNINGQNWWGIRNVTQNGWPASINTPSGVINPVLQSTGQCPSNWYTSTNGASISCWRNSQAGLTLYPATEKKLLFVDSEVSLNTDWAAFWQVVAGQVEQGSVPTESVPISYDLGNGRQAMIDTSPIGPVRQSYRNSNHQITGGIKGEWEGWDVRATASTGKHRVQRAYVDGLITSRSAFSAVALTPEAWGQESRYLSTNVLNQYIALLRPYETALDDGQTNLQAIDVLASKEVGATELGPIAMGLGLNWRNESVEYTSPFTYRPSFARQRQNWATHAELQSAITETQEITLAVRHDQYSDFGGVQTGKIGWRWQPAFGFMVRGAIGTGFRAPTLGQMTSVTTDLVTTTDQRTGTTIQERNGGNPNLKPEQSTQATLGIRWEPSTRWSMGADLWQVHIRDTFGSLTPEQVLSSTELRNKYISVNGNTTYLNLINLNLGVSERQGIDYDIQWREPTDIGRLRLSLRGTRNLLARKQLFEGGAFESELGRYANSTQSVTPKHLLVFSAGLEQANWIALAALNYRSGFENTMLLAQNIYGTATDVIGQVSGFWTLDLNSRWQASKAWALSASLQNLTDRQPPTVFNTASYFAGADTRMANYYGRTLRLKAEYKF